MIRGGDNDRVKRPTFDFAKRVEINNVVEKHKYDIFLRSEYAKPLLAVPDEDYADYHDKNIIIRSKIKEATTPRDKNVYYYIPKQTFVQKEEERGSSTKYHFKDGDLETVFVDAQVLGVIPMNFVGYSQIGGKTRRRRRKRVRKSRRIQRRR